MADQVWNQIGKTMTSNSKHPNSFAAVRRNPGTRADDQEFKVGWAEGKCTKDEPKLPKGYRDIRSAIEAVLEYAGEHSQADLPSRT